MAHEWSDLRQKPDKSDHERMLVAAIILLSVQDAYASWTFEQIYERLIEIMPEVEPLRRHAFQKCLCIVGCSVNGACPIHGEKAKIAKVEKF